MIAYKVDLLTPFCREYDYVRDSRVSRIRRKREALLPLYLEQCLDIVLFGHTWIDLELLKVQCVYVCKTIYEVDHLIWHCERFGSERHRLIDALSDLDVLHGTPVRDMCGLRKWSAIKCCLDFLGSFKIGF
jgi:hypothetical protein